MPEKAQEQEESAIDFYNGKDDSPNENNMIIQISGGDDPATAANQSSSVPPPPSPAPKKRAETWAQEESRALIFLRKEIDFLFNTSKSNKHLWENISLKMREKGFDRSPTMCTDKWRNLLKEYKKAKQNNQDVNGNGNGKMNFYKDIEEIMRERSKNGNCWKNSATSNEAAAAAAAGSKVDPFMQFSDKGYSTPSLLLFFLNSFNLFFFILWEWKNSLFMGLCYSIALLSVSYYMQLETSFFDSFYGFLFFIVFAGFYSRNTKMSAIRKHESPFHLIFVLDNIESGFVIEW